MAFVVAPEKLIKSLSYLVSIRIMSLDWMTQKMLEKYLGDGRYYENVHTICDLNCQKRDLMCGYLDRLLPLGLKYRKPKGGVYIWAELPEGVDSRDVVAESRKREISLYPGDVFYPNKNGGRNFIRLNYSTENIARIKLGMENLVEIIGELAKNRLE